MIRISRSIYIIIYQVFLILLVACSSIQRAVIEQSPAPQPSLVVPPELRQEEPTPSPPAKKKKSVPKSEEKETTLEVMRDLETRQGASDSQIFPSSKERALTSDVKTGEVSDALLAKMEGRWLPVGFLRDVQKKSSMLDVGFFPPVAAIEIFKGELTVTLTNGREAPATLGMKKKVGEVNVRVGQRTFNFIFRGNEFVWDMGQRRDNIAYRKPRDPEDTYERMLNEAMIAGKYYSMLTRTSIIFYDDGKIAGMGKRYNRYRFAQSQQELDRSNLRFDLIFLYHSQNPSAGKWFAIVPDERNQTTVLANIRERENQWHLSNTAYMLKPADSK
ncbi:MAG: hypothetical protein ACRCVN_01050 [Spirochaetia bacterium]